MGRIDIVVISMPALHDIGDVMRALVMALILMLGIVSAIFSPAAWYAARGGGASCSTSSSEDGDSEQAVLSDASLKHFKKALTVR